MQAHPNKTFTAIRALGNDNIRLNTLTQELENQLEEMSEENKNFGDQMIKKLHEMFESQNRKEMALHACIDRLENEICRLRGGGKMMHGIWFSDEEFVVATQLIEAGQTEWDKIVENKLAALQSCGEDLNDTYYYGRERSQDSKGKGESAEGNGKGNEERAEGNGKGNEEGNREEKEKKKQGLNPSVVSLSPFRRGEINQIQQAFVPSVASSSSPAKSDTTV